MGASTLKKIVALILVVSLFLIGCRNQDKELSISKNADIDKTNKEERDVECTTLYSSSERTPIYCFEMLYDYWPDMVIFHVEDSYVTHMSWDMDYSDDEPKMIFNSSGKDWRNHTITIVTVKEVLSGDMVKKGDRIAIIQHGGVYNEYEHINEGEVYPEIGKDYFSTLEAYDPGNDEEFRKQLAQNDERERFNIYYFLLPWQTGWTEIKEGKTISSEYSLIPNGYTSNDLLLLIEQAKQGFCKLSGEEINQIWTWEIGQTLKDTLSEDRVYSFLTEFRPDDVNNYIADKWWAEHTQKDFDEDTYLFDFVRRWENGEIWYRYEDDPADEYSSFISFREQMIDG